MLKWLAPLLSIELLVAPVLAANETCNLPFKGNDPASLVPMSCEMQYKANDCDAYFAKNPAAKKYARSCAKSDKWYAPALEPIDFGLGCGEGSISFAEDFASGIQNIAALIKDRVAKSAAERAKAREFEKACDRNFECKKLLVETMNLHVPLTQEEIKARSVASIMRLRRKLFQTAEEVEAITEFAKSAPEATAVIAKSAMQAIHDSDIRVACYNTRKRSELLCFGALMVTDPTKYLKWVTGARKAAGVIEVEVAALKSERVLETASGGRAAGTSSLLAGSAHVELENAGRELNHLIKADLTAPTGVHKINKKESADLFTISDRTAKASDAALRTSADELGKLGFRTTIETIPPKVIYRDGRYIQLPEHKVLTLEPGMAKGLVARELQRIERDVAERMKDPEMPEAVREKPLRIVIDPLNTGSSGADGMMAVDSKLGPTMGLSLDALMTGSEDEAVDILRHELRHSKAYYDLVAGKPTPYRGGLYGTESAKAVDQGVYAYYFPFDEMAGRIANVRTAQARLGKETETVAKLLRSKAEVATDQMAHYLQTANEAKEQGLSMARVTDKFADSTLENIVRARRALLDDGYQSHAKLSQRISIEAESSSYPGQRKVVFDTSMRQPLDSPQLFVYIPKKVVKKGNEAIRDYAISYLDDLEKHTRQLQKELSVRVQDLKQDPYARLARSKPASAR